MTTAFITHASGLDHLVPPGHPERPDRLRIVTSILMRPAFQYLVRIDAPRADTADIALCHTPAYIDSIAALAPAKGFARIDGDTTLSPGSWDAALHAVGAVITGVDMILDGQVTNAFVAVRPPGHHAEKARANGFCIFGTAAIAARHALVRHGLTRVAVLDFDLHHCNGTQDLLWDEPGAFLASTHQDGIFPGTGERSETGAHGQILNRPLKARSGTADMRAAWDEILAAMATFGPELVILSAGFDAHRNDPLGGLEWTYDDYRWLTDRILDATGGRVLSILEGGYDLSVLAACTFDHVQSLMAR